MSAVGWWVPEDTTYSDRSNHRPSGTEPPVDQLAQFSLAQVMAPGVGSKRHGGIPQGGKVVRRLLNECDRPVAVLLTRGYPRGHASRADASREEAAMQHRNVGEDRRGAREGGGAGAAGGGPWERQGGGVEGGGAGHAGPVEAVGGMREGRR